MALAPGADRVRINPSESWRSVAGQKPRIVATTDGEIDDPCSMVRFLLYANEWDIEGIIASSSQYHAHRHNWAGDDWVRPYLDAYAKVYPNLVKHDPAFTPWSTAYAWFPGGNTTSATFDGITVTFTRVGSSGTGLKPGYWKNGVVDLGVKLVGDGIKVDNGDSGPAQIEMRLAGLTPGPHTLLTYHNDWDNHAAYSIAPLNIFVDGVPVVTNLPLSVRALTGTDAASAYLELDAVEGQDVVVVFAADTHAGGSYATRKWLWGVGAAVQIVAWGMLIFLPFTVPMIVANIVMFAGGGAREQQRRILC